MTEPDTVITARFDPTIAERIREIVNLDFQPWDKGRLTPEELPGRLVGRPIFVTEIDRVDLSLLSQCPDLRVIITCRGNPVNVDIPACSARGVAVLNTPGRNAGGVADLALALILACARHLVPAAALLREGGWNQRDRGSVYRRFEGRDLDDSTVGLVGFGAVARALARRLSGFGTRILAHDPYVEPGVLTEHGVEASDLRTVMAEADFVSIHVPVTDETRRMLGPGQLALLKPTAYLINTGRSGAVDQEAMYDALKGGRIAGAALDVYDEEPLPEDSPLRLP